MDGSARTLRHESELGTWELVLRAPDVRLRTYVGEYQGYEETGVPPPLRQQAPTTRLPVIVNFASPWHIASSADGAREEHRSFVAGLGDRSTYVAAAGPARCLQVDLTPLGAYALLGVPMRELTNR